MTECLVSGHEITALVRDVKFIELTGKFCPYCSGQILLENRLLMDSFSARPILLGGEVVVESQVHCGKCNRVFNSSIAEEALAEQSRQRFPVIRFDA